MLLDFSPLKRKSQYHFLLIYPEIIGLTTFKISTSQQAGDLLIRDSSFQDKSRIYSLREYLEGDSIKSIH